VSSSSAAADPPRVAIIGGGISGLAAAHRLGELDPSLGTTVFEAAPELGGVLRTQRVQGYLLEHSADNFLSSIPAAMELCQRLGFAAELVPTEADRRRALVALGGRLYAVPEGFLLMEPRRLWPLLKSPILSIRGRLRLLAERFVPRRRALAGADESVASFARRRLGREAFERLVQPLASGIYTADAEKLSLAATMPHFLEMEREHGSLIRAVRQRAGRTRQTAEAAGAENESGARYAQFVAPSRGMASLIEALQRRLTMSDIRLSSIVERLEPADDGSWLVHSRPQAVASADLTAERFAAVVLAVPAWAARSLVQPFDAELAGELNEIPYAGSVVALVGVERMQIGRAIDGFGIVVPHTEGRQTVAVSVSSYKYTGRAPEGRVLLRVFLGGAMHPEILKRGDDELRQIVLGELAELIGLEGEPELFRVVRWEAAMPQYHVGHVERVQRIDELTGRWPGLQLAGNAYRGVGIPQCIASGEQAAEKISRDLKSGAPRITATAHPSR
jgi:oxygen-dependent protoporphyrinogen oxidase